MHNGSTITDLEALTEQFFTQDVKSKRVALPTQCQGCEETFRRDNTVFCGGCESRFCNACFTDHKQECGPEPDIYQEFVDDRMGDEEC